MKDGRRELKFVGEHLLKLSHGTAFRELFLFENIVLAELKDRHQTGAVFHGQLDEAFPAVQVEPDQVRPCAQRLRSSANDDGQTFVFVQHEVYALGGRRDESCIGQKRETVGNRYQLTKKQFCRFLRVNFLFTHCHG